MSIDIAEGRKALLRIEGKTADLQLLSALLDTLENLWNSRRFSFMAHAMTGTAHGVWSQGTADEPARPLTVDEIADRAAKLADAATKRLRGG
jgi:hypothetical protein